MDISNPGVFYLKIYLNNIFLAKYVIQSYFVLDLNSTTFESATSGAVSTAINSDPIQANSNQVNGTVTAHRISNAASIASDNSIAQTSQGTILVSKSFEEICRNARNLKKIFTGATKSRPHIRREDLKASRLVMDPLIYKNNNSLTQHLENEQATIVQETNIKSALIHGPLGANARDLILKRALIAFNKELKQNSDNSRSSNIVIFCSNDIACDDMARRMFKFMPPESKDRLEVLSAMRVVRDDNTLNNYYKLEADDTEQNKPKIFFVNAHSIKAKIKKDDDSNQVSKKLSKLTKILKLPDLKYLYFTQAHELSTSVNDNLFDYLIRTINPMAQKAIAEQGKKENQPLELLGSTYYKPQRGSDAANSVNLEGYFSGTTIYLPSPNQLIVSGQMPGLDEKKTFRQSTKVGEKTSGTNGKHRTIDLKIDYLHDTAFLNGIVDEYINSFHSDQARNLISLERDEKSLQNLIDVLKSKKIAFAVLTGEGLSRFDSEGNEFKDFKSRIEILDRLGKDYPLLVHYDEALLSSLEIPVDNQILLCLPDISDDKTEAAIAQLKSPYSQEERNTRPNQRGLLYVERSPHIDRKNRKTIPELIIDTERRHDDGKNSRGRFIANGNHHHSNCKSSLVTPINRGSGTTDQVSIKVEDEEWFKFLGEILGIENTDDYNAFAQKLEEEIDGYAEIILDQIGLEKDDLNQTRVVNIVKGKEPYDKLKRDVIKAFIDNDQKFLRAAITFPHIVGIETTDEAIAKTKLEIQNANLEREFNSKWFTELNKVSGNKAISLVGAFLLEKGDQYGKPLYDDELLHSALRVILSGQEKYNGSSENAKQLFLDFYNYINRQYSLAALKANQILTETEIGKDLKIDFKSSLNLNRPDDLYNNVLIALEELRLYLKNQAWLNLLDGALGIKSLSDKSTYRTKLISNYIQNSPLALGFINTETSFKNLISILLGNTPDLQLISLEQAKNIFSKFVNFINNQPDINKLDTAIVKKAMPSLFDPAQQINDLNSAKTYIAILANTKPQIGPSQNWSSLVASCASNNGVANSSSQTLNLIAEFLFEKHRNLFEAKEEKNLKKTITLLACHNGSHLNGEPSTSTFAEFCDWLNQKNPNLNPIQIHRHAANSSRYEPSTRITTPEQAKIAIQYVISGAKPKSNSEWLEHLDQLEANKNHLDIFAEYLLASRTREANPYDAFKNFDDLKATLSLVVGNGQSHHDGHPGNGKSNGKVPDTNKILEGFISFLKNKYGENFDLVKVRAWFPEQVEFTETIKTNTFLEKSISRSLNKIFPKVTNYPEFLQKLFSPEPINDKLASFITKFLSPNYQEQINQIQNETELERLLKSMLGLNKNLTEEDPVADLMGNFIENLLNLNPSEVTYIHLQPFYPAFIDMSAQTNYLNLAADEKLEFFTQIVKSLTLQNQSILGQNTTWLTKLDLAINNGTPLPNTVSEEYKLDMRSCVIADFLIQKHPKYLTSDIELLKAMKILLGDKSSIEADLKTAKSLIQDLNEHLRESENPPHLGVANFALARIFPQLFQVTKEDILSFVEIKYKHLLQSEQQRIKAKHFGIAIAEEDEGGKLIDLDLAIKKSLQNELGLNLEQVIKTLGIKIIDPEHYNAVIKDCIGSVMANDNDLKPDSNFFSNFKGSEDLKQIQLTSYFRKIILKEDDQDEALSFLAKENMRLKLDDTAKLYFNFEIYQNKIIARCFDPQSKMGEETIYTNNDNAWTKGRSKNINNLPSYCNKDIK